MALVQKLARVTRWLRCPYAGTNSLWSVLAWIGSFGMGLSVFMFLARHSHFGYRSSQDIVATSAFEFYPEQQDVWLYLLFVSLVPVITLLGYGLWRCLCNLIERTGGNSDRRDFTYITLTYLVWWIDPAAYLVAHRAGTMPLHGIGLLFVLSNSLFVLQRRLSNLALSRPSGVPPRFALWVGVLVIGGMIGMFLIVSPFLDILGRFPFWTLLGTAIATLSIWLSASYWLSHVSLQAWAVVAGKLALALIPLSALPLESLFWLNVYQEEARVSESISWLAVVILIVAVIFASVAIGLIKLRTTQSEIRIRRDFWRGFFCFVVPILLYVWVYDPNIHNPLDLFHEGERLTPAQAILAGQVPYRDVVFVHGFLRDPGVAMIAFRLFGTSFASLRTLEHLLTPLALVASYYLVLVGLGRGWGILYGFLAVGGVFPIFYDWRIVPTISAITFFLWYLRRGHVSWILGASLFTLLALATSFDVGMVCLFAGGVLLFTYWLFEQRSRRAIPLLTYLLPLALGGGFVLLYFARFDALGAFFNWHWEILAVYRDWNGMPYPLNWRGFFEVRDAVLSPATSVLGIVLLTQAGLRRRWTRLHWIGLLLLLCNLALFNRGIVSGYAGGSALSAGSHFAPILFMALGTVCIRSVDVRRIEVILPASVLGLMTFLPISTEYSSDWSWFAKIANLPEKNRVNIPSDWVQSDIDRVGHLYIPASQERAVSAITRFLKDRESFWDFTDHGALFFLSNHSSPTRFYATHHVITGQNQREVIIDLEREKPSYILYRSHTGWDAIAGVDRSLRNFLIAEYLLRHYRPAGQVGGFDLLERGEPQSSPAGVPFRVNLGHVPFLWGQDRVDTLSTPDSNLIAEWDLSSGNLAEWRATSDISVSEIRREGLFVRTAGPDAQLQNLGLALDPRSVTYLVLRVSVKQRLEKDPSAQVFWQTRGEGFMEERSVIFSLVPDGKEHVYLVRLASFPSWMWSDTITGIRLDPGNLAGIDLTIKSIQMMNVKEY